MNMKRENNAALAAVLLIGLASAPAAANPTSWRNSSRGTVCATSFAGDWIASCNPDGPADFWLMKWNGSSYVFDPAGGGGTHVNWNHNTPGSSDVIYALASDGSIWYNSAAFGGRWTAWPRNICNGGGTLIARKNAGFKPSIAGRGFDTWVLSEQVTATGDRFVYHWNGSCWELKPGLLDQLAIDFVTMLGMTTDRSSWHWNGSGWDFINHPSTFQISRISNGYAISIFDFSGTSDNSLLSFGGQFWGGVDFGNSPPEPRFDAFFAVDRFYGYVAATQRIYEE